MQQASALLSQVVAALVNCCRVVSTPVCTQTKMLEMQKLHHGSTHFHSSSDLVHCQLAPWSTMQKPIRSWLCIRGD